MNALDEFSQLRKEAVELEVRNERNRERLFQLQSAVSAGKSSTGDPLRDFLLVIEGDPFTPKYDKLSALEAQLQGCIGELVLAIVMEAHRTVISENPGPAGEPHRLYPTYVLGVLNGEKFLFDLPRRRAELPTSRFIVLDHAPSFGSRAPSGVREGNIPFFYYSEDSEDRGLPWCSITELGEEPQVHGGYLEGGFGGDGPALRFLVGDQALSSWIEVNPHGYPVNVEPFSTAWLRPKEFHPLALALGHPLPGADEVVAQKGGQEPTDDPKNRQPSGHCQKDQEFVPGCPDCRFALMVAQDGTEVVYSKGIPTRVPRDQCRCPILEVGGFCPVHGG